MGSPASKPLFSQLGDYQIQSELGAGGMGVVFKAFDQKLDRTVALKFLTPGANANSTEAARLLREARAASALDHENIATIHAVERTDDDRLFIVMAYYEGQSLDALMRSTPLSIKQAVDIVIQVGRGLAHAHEHHVVHGDIKPSNIILTSSGVAKIVDFGLSRKVGKDAATQTVSFAGTLPYLSPEQARGGLVNELTDVWSLGVLAYQLLSRRLPFEGESPAATLNAILTADPPVLAGLPPELNTILQKALNKNISKRYRSCAEFIRDLATLELKASAETVPMVTQVVTKRSHSLRIEQNRWFRTRNLVVLLLLSIAAFVLAPRGYRWLTHKPAAYELYLKADARLQRFDVPDNLTAAISLFEQTIQKDPKFALAYAGLAEAYRDKYRVEQDPKWLDKASEYCQKAAELNDKLPDVYVTLGRIHYTQDRNDLAQQELQRALDLDRSNPKALLGMADLKASLGQNQEAESLYRRVIALRPSDWQAYNNFGFYFWNLRRYPEAAEQFRNMIAVIPDGASGHLNLANILDQMGNDKEAEAELKRALELGPSYHIYTTLGSLYHRQKRYSEAIGMTLKAVGMNANDYRVWANLAQQYDAVGQSQNARSAREKELVPLEKMAALKQSAPKVQADLAFLLAKLGRMLDAKKRLEVAVALSPDDPEVLFTLGQTCELLGDRNGALEYLRRAIAQGYSVDDLKADPELQALIADPKVLQALQPATPALK